MVYTATSPRRVAVMRLNKKADRGAKTSIKAYPRGPKMLFVRKKMVESVPSLIL